MCCIVLYARVNTIYANRNPQLIVFFSRNKFSLSIHLQSFFFSLKNISYLCEDIYVCLSGASISR